MPECCLPKIANKEKIKHNSNQNPSRIFCYNWQTDLKVKWIGKRIKILKLSIIWKSRKLENSYYLILIKLLGWPKTSFKFVHNTLWKNLNELFGQPNKCSTGWHWQKEGHTDQWNRRGDPETDPHMWSIKVMNWFVSPIKRYAEVPSLSTTECDLIWRLGLCGFNQLKATSLRWALIHYIWCLLKRGNLNTDMRERWYEEMKEHHVEHRL